MNLSLSLACATDVVSLSPFGKLDANPNCQESKSGADCPNLNQCCFLCYWKTETRMIFKFVCESDFGFHRQTFKVHLHYVLCHGLLWTERLLELMPEHKTGETLKPLNSLLERLEETFWSGVKRLLRIPF